MDELMQKKAELMLDVEMLPDVIDDVPHKGFRKLTNTEWDIILQVGKWGVVGESRAGEVSG